MKVSVCGHECSAHSGQKRASDNPSRAGGRGRHLLASQLSDGMEYYLLELTNGKRGLWWDPGPKEHDKSPKSQAWGLESWLRG